MPKRKREEVTLQLGASTNGKTRKLAAIPTPSSQTQISLIYGSYEKILHNIIVSLPKAVLEPSASKPHATGKENVKQAAEKAEGEQDLDITFADSFLFTAHASSIRCLALSPMPEQSDTAQKLLLATGSADEKINVYNISACPPATSRKGDPGLPSLSGVKVLQNAWNRELGSLLHHAGPVNALHFPTRSKLLSAAEDNTIAVSRTRDWNVLSTIKAPIPKQLGRPSGDTSAPGEVPAGINSFAVHPSMRLMVSVGKGEKSMRLFNLVTGKKAGVLTFDRDMLQQVGEGKYGTGEGRRILWDEEGEEFVVAFESGACVFDQECTMKAAILPRPASKVHQLAYVPGLQENMLAVSTEDGRILFFDTNPEQASAESQTEDVDTTQQRPTTKQSKRDKKTGTAVPIAPLLAQLGGRSTGVQSRIKDFVILASKPPSASPDTPPTNLIIVSACSDGTIRIWSLSLGELEVALDSAAPANTGDEKKKQKQEPAQLGHLLAQYDTGNRITCLAAFIMNERVDRAEEGERSAGEDEEDGDGASKSGDSDSD